MAVEGRLHVGVMPKLNLDAHLDTDQVNAFSRTRILYL